MQGNEERCNAEHRTLLPALQKRAWPAVIQATVRLAATTCRADKGGVVHAGIGKCSFAAGALHDNAAAFAQAILAARPKGVKGGAISGYLLSASLCSSMGPGIPLNVASLVSVAQSTRKAE